MKDLGDVFRPRVKNRGFSTLGSGFRVQGSGLRAAGCKLQVECFNGFL